MKLNFFFITNNITFLQNANILTPSIKSTWSELVKRTQFIPTYYTRNENMWQDGFLFDFLQKKTADAWTRRFVIYTGFLFSERLVFDSIVRIYLDNLIWPGHKAFLFEAANVSDMLSTVIFILLTLFFSTSLLILHL